MAVTSARDSIALKSGHFEHEDARIQKYTLADNLPAKLSELALHPHVMLQPNYSLRRLTVADKDLMLKFLRRFFFRDEPMNKAIKLLETPESRCLPLEDYAANSLRDDVSVAAVSDDGDFVGVILNGIVTREDAAKATDDSKECPDPKFRRILGVLGHLEQEARIWEHAPKSCHAIMEVKIVSTHADWRGRGLMRVLCEESERIAMEMGATMMRMDTTSAFSAAAAERLGYKKIYCIPYAELPDAPQPETPHLEASVYLKELRG